MFLEDAPKQAAATLQLSAPQQSAAQHAANIPSSPSVAAARSSSAAAAAHCSLGQLDVLTPQSSRKESQAAHANNAPPHQHFPSQMDRSMSRTAVLSRAPLHGPRLPDRPHKRKAADRQAEPHFRLSKHAKASQELSPGDHTSMATAAMSPSDAHAKLTNKSGPEQQGLPLSHNEHKASEPLQRNTSESLPACKRIKVEHVPSQEPAISDAFPNSPELPPQRGSAPSAQGNQLNLQGSSEQALSGCQQLRVTDQPESSAAAAGLQQLLLQFGSHVVKSEAAKETALVQLVMLVADSM